MEIKYPKLTQIMSHCLYQDAAPSFSEAILMYTLNGSDAVIDVIKEINELLEDGYAENQVLPYVSAHCDYLENGNGIDTLRYIRKVLLNSMRNN